MMLAASLLPTAARAQASALSLSEALALARRASPDLAASREAVGAARARERQASVRQNPTVAFNREQSAGGGQSNAQNVAALEQPIEPGPIRSARVAVAAARREAAEARLGIAEAQLEFEVTRAYATALAADRRSTLADHATAAFTEALRVSERRLAAGDVSAYTHRRLKLEAARHATVRAEAVLARRAARLALASFVAPAADSIGVLGLALSDPLPTRAAALPADSLMTVALRGRGELRAAEAEGRAADAEARLAASERLPVPVVSAGLKTERVSTAGADAQGLRGVVIGVALPLPLWDRRAGTIEAAAAEARRRAAETDAQRRRVSREVLEAFDALRAAEAQIELLAPQLGAESAAALRAAQVAYTEGEISLVEWLDAVRAYREAEASHASLQAELLIRRAALDRAVGAPPAGERPASTAPRAGTGAPDGGDR